MTLTKERLEQYAYDDRMCNTNDEIREMARMALAGMETEPVVISDDMAYAFHHALSDSSLGADEVEEIKTGLRTAFANVAAPQPLTTSERADLDNYRNAKQVVPDEQHSERFGWTLGQWAEHVGGHHQGNDPANYYEFGSFMAVAAMLRQFGTVQQKLGWNACRAAMLQAGNSPVVTDGWVACSERMPEAGQYVLCLDNGDKYQNCIPDHDDIYTAAYCDRLGSFTTEYWGDHDWMSKRNPTHWSPLPDMPAAPQQEAE